MSAYSPRGSLSGISDVAIDFEDSLKDLSKNDRYEIGNLTTIARESTEHAQAISTVLEKHIKSTAPPKKLPALYVLDSIVKNVGTPYTLFFGRNLYTTFMEAYTLVDSPTRRAMDALLKTWKEPVPGSISQNPVFGPEVVRPIENALLKAKTAALRNQGHAQPQQAFGNTYTPPQFDPHYGAPQMQPPQPQQPFYGYCSQQPTPQQHQPWPPAFPPPTPQQQQQQQPSHLAATPVQQPSVDINVLRADINSLVSRFQGQFAAAPNDAGLRAQLGALLQLKALVDSGQVPAHSLQQVKDQVSALAASAPVPRQTPQPVVSTPQWQPPAPVSQPYQAQISVPQPYQQPPQAVPQPYQQPSLPVTLPFMQPPAPISQQPPVNVLAPGALNGLQALLANDQKLSTPPMRTAVPALQNAPHSQLNGVRNNVAAVPPANTADLLAALTKSGVLNNLPATSSMQPTAVPASAPASPPAQTDTASLLKSLQAFLPPAAQNGTPTLANAQRAGTGKARIPLSNASLKTFRPDLVRSLYEDQPNQCNTCGRRFLATEEGRAKKERHLDWHFRTNHRMADPALSRGQHRQWFVDEVQWINIREFDPSTATAADTAASKKVETAKGPQDQYLRAAAGVTRMTCSICQEEMKSSFLDEQQDWVFVNAVVFNGKPAHATCVEELKKPICGAGALAAALSVAGIRQGSATPECSSLGKRKAESVLAGTGAKIRMG